MANNFWEDIRLLISPLARYCIKPKKKPSTSDNIDMTDFYDDDYDLDEDDYDDEEDCEAEDTDDSGNGK